MKANLSLLWFFLLLVPHNLMLAQIATSEYIVKKFTVSNGLSYNQITCSVQDSYGYLWFGSYDGLNRFDGVGFKIYRHSPNNSKSISKSQINCVYQDKDSVLWVGTKGGGLSRYNRTTDDFTNYNYNRFNPYSISHNEVYTIYEDSKNNFWVGTDGGGLNKFDRKSGRFQLIKGISSGKILCIAEDKIGNLWLGTWDGGIFILNIVSGRITHLPNIAFTDGNQRVNIWNMKFDSEQNLWIALYGFHLVKYNPRLNTYISYQDSLLAFGVKRYFPRDIFWDKDSAFWLSSNEGLFRSKTVRGTNRRLSFGNFEKILSGSFTFLYYDKRGTLWVGAATDGLLLLQKRNSSFGSINLQYPPEARSIEGNRVIGIIEDTAKGIWFSDGRFIFRYNSLTHKFIIPGTNSLYSKDNFAVYSFYRDAKGQIWVGKEAEVGIYNPKTNKFDYFLFTNNEKYKKIGTGNISIIDDSDGQHVWLGTYVGLFRLNTKTFECRQYFDETASFKGLSTFRIATLCMHGPDTLLIGTFGGGLILFDKKTEKYTHFINIPGDTSSLSNNFVNFINKSANNEYWLSTFGGLNHFNINTKKFISYTSKDGLPADILQGVLEDNSGNIWISNSNGLSRFNKHTRQFVNFYIIDNKGFNSFGMHSCYKGSDGKFYFGWRNGALVFHPDSVFSDTIPPTILFTDFRLFNKSLKVGNGSPLSVNIEQAKSIVLKHYQSSVSFEFTIFDFISSEVDQYAYKLEGFDKEWVYAGNKNIANYTNLPPGKYLFRVRAANRDGVWNNDGAKIEIIILHPFWQTWVFRVLIFVTLCGLLYYWYTHKVKSIKKTSIKLESLVKVRTSELSEVNVMLEERNEEIEQQKEEVKSQRDELLSLNALLEQQKREIQNQNLELESHRNNLELLVANRTKELEIAKHKAEESDRLKSAFLANMSHEIRTPLNAIVGFSSMMTSPDLSSVQREEFGRIINSSSDSLLALVDDILDLSKIEAGQILVTDELFSAKNVINEVCANFQNELHKNDLEIRINIDEDVENLLLFSDKLRFKQVLINLISNAIKFTSKGYVEVGYLINENHEVQIYVKDTGIGIESSKFKFIFERFTKVDTSSVKFYPGTGLGLFISKKLVELLGGRIWVESIPGQGSIFHFTLHKYQLGQELAKLNPKPEKIILNDCNWSGFTIAVAEDEENNYLFLEYTLKNCGANVLRYKNGADLVDAFSKNNNPIAHLVLMDIKMPVMDGFRAFELLRARHPTIPVIAQTAYAMKDDIERITEAGFTDYVSKPIRPVLLRQKINCILKLFEQ